ncbi:MAG: DUF1592 domain-containing protein [Isosphaeraceae bacterium]|nr:DUF1592 domain-containing protein [Isosphaeraceae bacterium]
MLPACLWAGETGEQIYAKRCASCHGAQGEGTPQEYPQPLAGNRSVAQLARFIARSMPADAPGDWQGDEVDKVAAYIREAFYSKAAPARLNTPRLGVTRLTVGQYRSTVSDLIASFVRPRVYDDKRGLLADYYTTKSDGENKLVIQRLDPEVRFDFGWSSPEPKTIEPRTFMIKWDGSLLPPESGEYELIVRSEHAVSFLLNDAKRPLIDAWVKSGSETEYRRSIRLLAGRPYALRLLFRKTSLEPSTAKKKEGKDSNATATITLAWKRPHHVVETIPTRYLSPLPAPETFVPETPFPPDDRSAGFERGTSISKAWEQATTDAAIEAAGYVATHLGDLTGIGDPAPEHAPRLKEFCRQFAERAFRRPLTDEQKRLYLDRSFEGTPDPGAAVQRAVLLVLKSPRFLYQEIGGNDAYAVASRLAFALWDSLPDAELLQAAADGRLANTEQVALQARRMAADPRARQKLREFFLQWLKVDRPPDLAKSKAQFPGFNEDVASDLRTSLELFLDEVIDGDASDFRRLLLGDELYLNGRLAQVYGAGLPADAPFQKVVVDACRRAGLVSHPYLMAAFANAETSSPVHRGVFLVRNVLGRSLRPPPDAFVPLPVSLHPDLTTRQRVELQTKPQACQSCHELINPLGYALEHFDAIGRYRDQENGRTIDAKGSYLARAGDPVAFDGARALATFLASSEETHAAFVEKLFRHTVKAPVQAFGPHALPTLRQSFARNNFHIRKLLIEIATTSALKDRQRALTTMTP